MSGFGKKNDVSKKGQSDDKELQGRAEQNALMSLAFGVIGFALGCVGYGAVFGIIGIGFGVLGLKSKEKKKHAIAGIVLGVFSIAMFLVMAVVNLMSEGVQ